MNRLERLQIFTGSIGPARQGAARLLASRLGVPLLVVDLRQVVGKYIGETEKNLRPVLARASEQGAVLFFDEADALFGRRSAVKDSHDRYANQEVSYLLSRLEDIPGIAILATNRREDLDPEWIRRAARVVGFPPRPGEKF